MYLFHKHTFSFYNVIHPVFILERVSMLSKAQLYEAERRAERKFQADEKILQKIRYLKTECICRLFCTGKKKTK